MRYGYQEVWTAPKSYNPTNLFNTIKASKGSSTMTAVVEGSTKYISFFILPFSTYADAVAYDISGTSVYETSSVIRQFDEPQCMNCFVTPYDAFPLTLTVDGSSADWPTYSGFTVRYPFYPGKVTTTNTVYFQTLNGGTYTGIADHASYIGFGWRSTGLYVVARVTDATHIHTSTLAFQQDAMQILVATPDRNRIIYLGNMALRSDTGTKLVQNQWTPANTPYPLNDNYYTGDTMTDPPTGIRRNSTTKVTTYEVFLPVALLGVSSLSEGDQFAVSVAVVDGDTSSAVQQGFDGYAPTSIMFGKNPKETGIVTLKGKCMHMCVCVCVVCVCVCGWVCVVCVCVCVCVVCCAVLWCVF